MTYEVVTPAVWIVYRLDAGGGEGLGSRSWDWSFLPRDRATAYAYAYTVIVIKLRDVTREALEAFVSFKKSYLARIRHRVCQRQLHERIDDESLLKEQQR